MATPMNTLKGTRLHGAGRQERFTQLNPAQLEREALFNRAGTIKADEEFFSVKDFFTGKLASPKAMTIFSTSKLLGENVLVCLQCLTYRL